MGHLSLNFKGFYISYCFYFPCPRLMFFYTKEKYKFKLYIKYCNTVEIPYDFSLIVFIFLQTKEKK